MKETWRRSLKDFHFMLRFSFFQVQYDFNFFPFPEAIFVFTAELAEVCGLKEKPQHLQLFGKLCFLALVEELSHNLIIPSLSLCFHAG